MDENVYLVLGCYGRTEDGFVLCPSAENRILKLDETLESYEDIVNYIDSVRLFDKPLLDNNAIRHFIYNLQDRYNQKIRRLWSEREYHLLERFVNMHKPCGLYVRLIIVPEILDKEKDNEPISFVVPGVPEPEYTKFENKAIRCRR